MSVRTRKFIGAFLLVAFVCAYAVLVVMVGERLPDLAWVRGVFFAVAGLAWGAPILPLLSWMSRGRGSDS
jgi:multisubunit Na+/H+ antiporter MnhB subunit